MYYLSNLSHLLNFPWSWLPWWPLCTESAALSVVRWTVPSLRHSSYRNCPTHKPEVSFHDMPAVHASRTNSTFTKWFGPPTPPTLTGISRGSDKGELGKPTSELCASQLNPLVHLLSWILVLPRKSTLPERSLRLVFSHSVSSTQRSIVCLFSRMLPAWNHFSVLWSFQMDGSLLSWRIATNHWTGRRAPERSLPCEASQVLCPENGIREEDLWRGTDSL